jgi:nitrate/nitrite transporter NarK
MTKADLLALPGALGSFNGFYTHSGNFIMLNSMRVLVAEVILAAAVLIAVVLAVVVYVRRRRRNKRAN